MKITILHRNVSERVSLVFIVLPFQSGCMFFPAMLCYAVTNNTYACRLQAHICLECIRIYVTSWQEPKAIVMRYPCGFKILFYVTRSCVLCARVCVPWFFAACSFFSHFAKDFWSLNVSSLSITLRIQSTDEHKQVQRQNSNWISIFKIINRHMALKSSKIVFSKLCMYQMTK